MLIFLSTIVIVMFCVSSIKRGCQSNEAERKCRE